MVDALVFLIRDSMRSPVVTNFVLGVAKSLFMMVLSSPMRSHPVLKEFQELSFPDFATSLIPSDMTRFLAIFHRFYGELTKNQFQPLYTLVQRVEKAFVLGLPPADFLQWISPLSVDATIAISDLLPVYERLGWDESSGTFVEGLSAPQQMEGLTQLRAECRRILAHSKNPTGRLTIPRPQQLFAPVSASDGFLPQMMVSSKKLSQAVFLKELKDVQESQPPRPHTVKEQASRGLEASLSLAPMPSRPGTEHRSKTSHVQLSHLNFPHGPDQSPIPSRPVSPTAAPIRALTFPGVPTGRSSGDTLLAMVAQRPVSSAAQHHRPQTESDETRVVRPRLLTPFSNTVSDADVWDLPKSPTFTSRKRAPPSNPAAQSLPVGFGGAAGPPSSAPGHGQLSVSTFMIPDISAPKASRSSRTPSTPKKNFRPPSSPLNSAISRGRSGTGKHFGAFSLSVS
eukprot:NODE_1095_length_1581_cov_6.789817_g901_i0.p1 GENE.NODE_1095_length_1581_cov_6.789817_g901_i0~~NODE_1095_length_1581_cov_6.789817_g901_i0.p1  ORF type:complete len:504 (+),score=68.38 NODE_1095_length_1581_cov_6.789817_g901_i0:152-1513(+)